MNDRFDATPRDDRDRAIFRWLAEPESASARTLLDEAFVVIRSTPQPARLPWSGALDVLRRPAAFTAPRWVWLLLTALLIVALTVSVVVGAALLRSMLRLDGQLPVRPAAMLATPCPAEVVGVSATAVCQMATVPERHELSGGPSIRLLVTRFGTSAATGADPLLYVREWQAGDQPYYTGAAASAESLGRAVYVIDPRGVAHSEPQLACPEVDGLSVTARVAPASDASAMAAFGAAVTACRERLTAGGVDLAAYTLAEQAADIEAVRMGLGIGSWSLVSWGYGSRPVFEVIRRYPGAVRSAVLVSPAYPGADVVSSAAVGLRDGLAALDEACAADAGFCAASFGSPRAAYDAAVGGAAGGRVVTALDPATGQPVDLTIDPGSVARWLRTSLGNQQLLAATPARLAQAGTGNLSAIAGAVVAAPPGCLGYSPDCSTGSTHTFGAGLSVVCADEVPFAGGGSDAPAADPGLAVLVAGDPRLALCGSWGAAPSDAATRQPVVSDVPILVIHGRFDPFQPAALATAGMAGLRNGHLLVNNGETADPTGNTCIKGIYRAWLSGPGTMPDTSCVAAIPDPGFIGSP